MLGEGMGDALRVGWGVGVCYLGGEKVPEDGLWTTIGTRIANIGLKQAIQSW